MSRLPLPYDDRLPETVRELYPWQGRFLRVGDNIRMHYLDTGRGDPVLMLHGNPTWSFYWRELIRGLEDDYRCIVPDHVGCGLSDKPDDEAYGYRLQDRLDDIGQLIEALDLRDLTLVVHDWGGAIGLGTAQRYPERVKRLVILNTAGFLGPVPASITTCRLPVYGPLVIRGLNGFLRVGFLRAWEHPEKITPAIKQGYLAPYGSWGERRAIHRFIQDIPMEEDHPTRALWDRISEGLESLKDRDILLLWGEKDFCFTTEYCDDFERRFPDAEVHRFPDAGHWVMEDARERIVPLVRSFLEQHPIGDAEE